MDLGDPGVLISGLILGAVGTGMFVYGKKSEQYLIMFVGAIIAAIPYFVASILFSWLAAAGCVGGLYLHNRYA